MAFIVAHPDTQHSAHAAQALKRAGLLSFFATSASLQRPPLLREALRWLAPRIHDRLAQHRGHSFLASSEIRLFPLHMLAIRLGPEATRWSRRRFGRLVGELGVREQCGVLAYDTNAAETFRVLRPAGLPCILDESTVHRNWRKRLREVESEEFPAWADEPDATYEEEELALADTVLCGSEFAAHTLVTEGVPAEKIEVVPYGTDTTRFCPAEREQRDVVRILFVGSLAICKGIHYFAELARRLKPLGVTATAVGTVRVRPETLRPYADVLQIPGGSLHGGMPALYRQHDILVHPSLFEGSSISIYEALASGLPVVTTPSAGSIVRHEREGLVVPPRDLERMVEAVEALVRDRERRIEMGRAARRRAEEFGDWRHYEGRLAAALRRRHPSDQQSSVP
jgi:glycosyltransferase involved in cell wall biosynthesis